MTYNFPTDAFFSKRTDCPHCHKPSLLTAQEKIQLAEKAIGAATDALTQKKCDECGSDICFKLHFNPKQMEYYKKRATLSGDIYAA